MEEGKIIITHLTLIQFAYFDKRKKLISFTFLNTTKLGLRRQVAARKVNVFSPTGHVCKGSLRSLSPHGGVGWSLFMCPHFQRPGDRQRAAAVRFLLVRRVAADTGNALAG